MKVQVVLAFAIQSPIRGPKMTDAEAKKKAAKKVEKAVRKAARKGVPQSAVEKAVTKGMADDSNKKPSRQI
jgi:hypothetical protein